MTLQKKQTIRFVLVVGSILGVAMLTIYFFTTYFLHKNFYRRLNNRAETVVSWLSQSIEKHEDIEILNRYLSTRKDQLPYEQILIYNLQNKVIFSYNSDAIKSVEMDILNKIRLDGQSEFEVNGFAAEGMLYKTDTQRYMVLAFAKNEYGDVFLLQMRWLMLGITFVSLVLITIIGWFHAKKALEPINNIGNELNKIFPRNLNRRLPYQENEIEISRFSKTINQLLDRVGEGIQLQQMFIANVSHELKNPLTRISSQLEVSLLNERSAESYKKTILSVFEDISELIILTQNLLQLSRSNAESDIALVENIRIDDIFWEVQKTINKNYPNYKIDIHFSALPEDPKHLCIVGNHTLLGNAILNLVENACKFSSDNYCFLSLYASPQQKIISVKNFGKVIEFEEISKIFQPFYRSANTTEIKGYGIGLSLVDRIIKIHNGHIEVSSSIENGTEFKITFNA